ncbi:MAG: hypothetical protein ACTSX8_04065 [Alphaproteobacteria bacterium]
MKGYAEEEVFDERMMQLHREAQRLVASLPRDRRSKLRCHELARAVGRVLQLTVVDGKYGVVEHSWLSVTDTVILDVYVPGRAPMVQLLELHWALPHTKGYRPGAHVPSCEDTRCNQRLEHAERYHGRLRFWCRDHVPWSGHYEWCDEPCRALLADHSSSKDFNIDDDVVDGIVDFWGGAPTP